MRGKYAALTMAAISVLVIPVITASPTDFTWSPANPTPGDQITFTGEAKECGWDTPTYRWFIVDGTLDEIGLERVITHAFSSAGSYVIRYDAWCENWWGETLDLEEIEKTVAVSGCNNNNECESSLGETAENCPNDCGSINIEEFPTASFTFSPSNPTAGTVVNFDATGSNDPDGTIDRYEWDFLGDGSFVERNPKTTYTYQTQGSYDAKLKVTDNDGNSDFTTKTVPVGAANQPPVAGFSFSPSNPLTGESVSFDASASYDTDGQINSYAWTFGDGGTGSGKTVTHVYQLSGSYTVKLTVGDDDGAVDVETKPLSVGKANEPPAAKFSFTPGSPVAGQGVEFDASDSSDSDGQITGYDWDFGDGSTGNGKTVTHSYQQAGSYTVNLTVTDNNSSVAKTSKTVSVGVANQPPVARFFFFPVQPSVDQEVEFDANDSSDSDGQITGYDWDFGDGSTGNGTAVAHAYRNPGNYQVTLTVTDNEGDSSYLTKTVKPRPKISLQVEKMQVVQSTQLQVDFRMIISALGDLIPQTTEFDYGDGGNKISYPGLKKDVWHKYVSIGNFTASVEVKFTDGTEIRDETELENTGDGNLPPLADFAFSPLRPVANETVFFDASLSQDPDGEIERYEWDFDGDGTFEKDGRVITHQFRKTGNFTVRLKVTDGGGRTATAVKEVGVKNVRVSLNVVYRPDPFSVKYEVSLSELGSRSVVSTYMDFGDGEDDSYAGLKSSIIHTYGSSGIFDARVVVELDNGQEISDTAAAYIQSSSEGYVKMDFHIDSSVGAGKDLRGEIKTSYTKFIPKGSVMAVYIDGEKAGEKGLANKLNDVDYYSFKDHILRYEIAEKGRDDWATYPQLDFNFTIKASGTKGSPATTWNSSPFTSGGSINGGEGLKFIYDGSKTITPPQDHNSDTVWEVVSSTNPLVNLTMRQACGNDSARKTDGNGWIHKTFKESELTKISGTNHRTATIGGGFDGKSLREPERHFYGGEGGIYKNGKYLQYTDYSSDIQDGNLVSWNEESSAVFIFQYDATATYEMVYMTTNGPKLCGYTEVADADSSSWEKEAQFDVVVRYDMPFETNYTTQELLGILPPDNCTKPNCRQVVEDYAVSEVYDSTNSIILKSDFSSDILTIQAVTTSTELKREESFLLDLDDFENLTAPQDVGSHVLRMEITYNGEKIFENSTEFSVCPDLDDDGYCEPEDCDDDNPLRHPGADEMCNGIDDDCDSQVDEDFTEPGRILGTPCNDWPGSACSGIWVCGQNKTDVTCVGNYSIGELEERCDDGIDNDCDGKIDELTENVNGTLERGCIFREGEKRVCGSNIGYCRQGFRIFTSGEWSDCMGARGPRDETCNRIDDDCDGTVDNLGGATTAEAAQCWCVDDASPRNEICNDIDDNCNGEIDEGITCCRSGETRPCGTDMGICRKGAETCVNGQWDRKCAGSVQPREEICYNSLDDDCDGETDENCNIEITCRNGVMDMGEEGVDCGGPCPQECKEKEISSWIYVSLAGIVLILIAGVLVITGKI